jgi:hypothetical protein
MQIADHAVVLSVFVFVAVCRHLGHTGGKVLGTELGLLLLSKALSNQLMMLACPCTCAAEA